MAIPFLGCYKANQTANILRVREAWLGSGRQGAAGMRWHGSAERVWRGKARQARRQVISPKAYRTGMPASTIRAHSETPKGIAASLKS